MVAADQLRAAWSRRTDDELLHAFFLEELSAQGREVVTDLVTARVGSVDAYVRRFAAEQGEVVATIVVRGCDIAFEARQRDLPVMFGVVVLAAGGIGFVPAGPMTTWTMAPSPAWPVQCAATAGCSTSARACSPTSSTAPIRSRTSPESICRCR